MPQPPETSPPETLDRGRYVIERVLGQGGMATVYLARDARMGVHRAIKVLHPDVAHRESVRARFMAEAHAQAALKHPNVLMVHDAVEDDQGVYLVMELAEGDSVGRKVQDEGPMSAREAVEVGITIGNALAVAHASGLVHRDIKPANILIDRHGVYKLADFGIARNVERTSNLTQTGMVMGTWAYMPPEQREDSHSVDPRSDIYAFGVTLYTLLVGRESQRLHNQEAWGEAYAGVPTELAKILQRATRLYPEDRYPRVEDMVADLRRVRDALEREGDGHEPAAMAEGGVRPGDSGSTFLVPASTVELPAGRLPDAVDEGPRRALVLVATLLVGLLGFVTVVGIGSFVYLRQRDAGVPVLPEVAAPEVAAPEVAASEVAASEVAAPEVAAPEVAAPEVAAPEVAAPARTQPSTARTTPPKETTIIAVIPASGPATPAAVEPAPPPATATPTGSVVVRTIPSGAAVSLRGRTLTPGAGGAYALPAGTHTLDLRSASGEQTRRAVSVKAGESVEICYNFDTNSGCGGIP